MGLIKQAIKRPVAVLMLVLGVIIFGVTSFTSTPITLIPDMNMPMVMIYVTYPGAGPSEVASLVTEPLEDTLSTTSGIQLVQSISQEGASMIYLQYSFGTNMDEAVAQVRERLEMVSAMLPEDASSPMLMKMNMDDAPIVSLSVTSENIDDAYATVEEYVVPELEKILGVTSVDLGGGTKYEIVVELDEAALARYGVQPSAISSAIAGAGVNMPAGYLDQGDKSLFLRGESKLATAEQVANLPITLATGDVVRVGDLALVAELPQESSSISRINGQNNMSISVSKQQDANTLSVSSAVIKAVEKINRSDYNLSIDVVMDQGAMIMDSLMSVVASLMAGAVLAILVLWFFLGDWKASLIISISIPVSVIVTFVLMYFADMSINMVSMGGLVVGVGMMVDNAIVVLESMFRCRKQGMKYVPAAETGAKLVAGAVVASTLTSVVVYLPIVFMEGMSSELMGQAGLTIAFALLASLISAITLVPCLFVQLHPSKTSVGLADRFMERLQNTYSRVIAWALRHTKTVVALSVAALILSFCLMPFIGSELMTSIDEGQFSIQMETEQGLKLDALDEYLRQAEAVAAQIPDVEKYTASASSSSGGASVTVYLREGHKIKTSEAADMARELLGELPGCRVTVSVSNSMMMGVGGNSVTTYIQAQDSDSLEEAVDRATEIIRNVEGVASVTSDLSEGRPEARVEIDSLKAAAYGLNPAYIMSMVGQRVAGSTAATLTREGEEIAVKVRYPENSSSTLSDLRAMSIQSPTGASVPLVEVADIIMDAGPVTIMRSSGRQVASLTAQLSGRDYGSVNRDIQTGLMTMEFPGTSELYTGQDQVASMASEFTALIKAMLLAVALVFMVMACQFESLRFPMVVMTAVPMAAIGALLGLFITGCTINIISLIGMIVLVGIVVNNAIVLIDCVNQMRTQGLDIDTALQEAGKIRLRPILMTTLTTVLGQFPLSLGIGNGGQMMQSMAVVIMGGLLVSTILTLVVVPVLYKRSALKSEKRRARKKPVDPVPVGFEQYENDEPYDRQ